MKLNQKNQTLIGLFSVVILTVVAGGTFFSRYGSPTISADIKSEKQVPVLSIFPTSQSTKVNQEFDLNLTGDFRNQAVTGGTITLNFDSEKLEVKSILTDGYILEKSIFEEIDNTSGTIKLIFLPIIGVALQGDIAKLKLQSKSSGLAPITFEATGAENSLQPTSLSSPTEAIVLPDLVNSVINIEN